jgi:ribosomal protein S18 acetylase RimI-like enzyme
MKIVKAKLADSQNIAEMNFRLIRDEGHRNPMNQAQLTRRMKGWLKGDYRACLFQEQGKIIGYCLYRHDEGFAYIRHFFIERAYRKQGQGRKAFKLLLKDVWKGTGFLRLDVLLGNKTGIKFWKKVGFKEYSLTMERKKS